MTVLVLQGGKTTFISGGRAIVCPCVQTVQRIPLNTMTLEVRPRKEDYVLKVRARCLTLPSPGSLPPSVH